MLVVSEALARSWELEAGSSEMEAEGRKPSGEDRSWKLGDGRSGRADAEGEIGVLRRWRSGRATKPSGEDSELEARDALAAWGKFYTTATRLHNKAQGRFSAPWVHGRITHSQPRSGCTTERHSIVCNGIAPIRCRTSLRFGCGHLSRSQGALKRPWALLFIAFGETKPTPSPLRQRGSSSARAGFHLPSPISELPSPQPTRYRLMEYGDSSPFFFCATLGLDRARTFPTPPRPVRSPAFRRSFLSGFSG